MYVIFLTLTEQEKTIRKTFRGLTYFEAYLKMNHWLESEYGDFEGRAKKPGPPSFVASGFQDDTLGADTPDTWLAG